MDSMFVTCFVVYSYITTSYLPFLPVTEFFWFGSFAKFNHSEFFFYMSVGLGVVVYSISVDRTEEFSKKLYSSRSLISLLHFSLQPARMHVHCESMQPHNTWCYYISWFGLRKSNRYCQYDFHFRFLKTSDADFLC